MFYSSFRQSYFVVPQKYALMSKRVLTSDSGCFLNEVRVQKPLSNCAFEKPRPRISDAFTKITNESGSTSWSSFLK